MKHKNLKYTLLLIDLFKNKEQPEVVVKFIYKHVYKLIKEIFFYTLIENIYDEFNQTYDNYLDFLENCEGLWLNTIFPTQIRGYKNFFVGIACRLAFFSLDVEAEYIFNKEENADKQFNFLTTDHFYWYSDPINWTYSYALVLGKENKLYIKKCKFVILDQYNSVNLDEEKEIYTSFQNIHHITLSLFKNPGSDYGIDPFDDHSFKSKHTKNTKLIDNMMKEYKKNISRDILEYKAYDIKLDHIFTQLFENFNCDNIGLDFMNEKFNLLTDGGRNFDLKLITEKIKNLSNNK